MAHASYHPEAGIHPVEHWFAWIGAVLGLLAAGIGLWYAFGPPDGMITIWNWSSTLAEAASWVAPTLLIGGGALTTGAMAAEAVRDRDRERWLPATEAAVGLVGIAAIVVGLVVLF